MTTNAPLPSMFRYSTRLYQGQTLVIPQVLTTIHENNTAVLPPNSTGIRVISGTAYITHNGEDILAAADQDVHLTAGSHKTLISAVGTTPLTFIVY